MSTDAPAPAAPAAKYELDKSAKALHIQTLPEEVFLFRYAPTIAVPEALWAGGDGFCSVTKTKSELSVVAPAQRVVDAGMPKAAPEHSGGPWNVLRVRGPLEHRESPSPPRFPRARDRADPRHGRRHGRARARAQGGLRVHLHDLHLVSLAPAPAQQARGLAPPATLTPPGIPTTSSSRRTRSRRRRRRSRPTGGPSLERAPALEERLQSR